MVSEYNQMLLIKTTNFILLILTTKIVYDKHISPYFPNRKYCKHRFTTEKFSPCACNSIRNYFAWQNFSFARSHNPQEKEMPI
jgi:hypothetical protein